MWKKYAQLKLFLLYYDDAVTPDLYSCWSERGAAGT